MPTDATPRAPFEVDEEREQAIDQRIDDGTDLLRLAGADRIYLRSALTTVREELVELRRDVREWVCEDCRYVHPGPPRGGLRCVICPRCGGATLPMSVAERRELRTQLTAARAALARVEGERDAKATECTKLLADLTIAHDELNEIMATIGMDCENDEGEGLRVVKQFVKEYDTPQHRAEQAEAALKELQTRCGGENCMGWKIDDHATWVRAERLEQAEAVLANAPWKASYMAMREERDAAQAALAEAIEALRGQIHIVAPDEWPCFCCGVPADEEHKHDADCLRAQAVLRADLPARALAARRELEARVRDAEATRDLKWAEAKRATEARLVADQRIAALESENAGLTETNEQLTGGYNEWLLRLQDLGVDVGTRKPWVATVEALTALRAGLAERLETIAATLDDSARGLQESTVGIDTRVLHTSNERRRVAEMLREEAAALVESPPQADKR